MTPQVGTSTAPALGFAEACRVTGVSESTLRRRRQELLAAGATQTSKGWSIPIPVLIELGLMDKTTPAPGSPRNSPPAPRQEAVTAPATQPPMEPLVEALRAKLAAAEQRAAVAEAVAAERERIIEVQAQALRMIEAPKPAENPHEPLVRRSSVEPAPAPVHEQPAPAPEPAPEPSEQPKRRWWKR